MSTMRSSRSWRVAMARSRSRWDMVRSGPSCSFCSKRSRPISSAKDSTHPLQEEFSERAGVVVMEALMGQFGQPRRPWKAAHAGSRPHRSLEAPEAVVLVNVVEPVEERAVHDEAGSYAMGACPADARKTPRRVCGDDHGTSLASASSVRPLVCGASTPRQRHAHPLAGFRRAAEFLASGKTACRRASGSIGAFENAFFQGTTGDRRGVRGEMRREEFGPPRSRGRSA